jgi:acyl-CoA thioester hydrolase
VEADTSDVVETTFYVRYAETDAMGVAHHSSYIIWFEEGRSAWGRARGAPYSEFEQTGNHLALTEVHARYVAPAVYSQRITVRTCLIELRSRSLAFSYEVVDAQSGQLLASGTTRHICITQDGKPGRLPAAWLAKLKR